MSGKPDLCIEVKYIYSACIVTRTPDIAILHDPWFTEGVYDGSWFHFPSVDDPIGQIGEVDLIYISHIHPDHYDPKFLKAYFERYGEKEIVIAAHEPNYLRSKMAADGIAATVLAEEVQRGNTTIQIVPHKTGSTNDIDSAIIVKYDDGVRGHCVVNANDIIFDDPMLDLLKKTAGDVDILLCGYTGAGPYPQTYFDLDDPRLQEEAERKKLGFFDRYRRVTGRMGAAVNIPFAGKYMLGGRLASLNHCRGVADAVEVLAFDPKAVVLADGGSAINTSTLVPTSCRTEPYSKEKIARRLDEISSKRMDYERLMSIEEVHQLPLKRMLARAMQNARRKSECESDYFICIGIPSGESAVVNANRHSVEPIRFEGRGANLPEPRSEILIDPRYLFGLLTGVYHWNNGEVGSQYAVRRYPNEYNREAQRFLNFLAV